MEWGQEWDFAVQAHRDDPDMLTVEIFEPKDGSPVAEVDLALDLWYTEKNGQSIRTGSSTRSPISAEQRQIILGWAIDRLQS